MNDAPTKKQQTIKVMGFVDGICRGGPLWPPNDFISITSLISNISKYRKGFVGTRRAVSVSQIK
jgi:hypothetical protein